MTEQLALPADTPCRDARSRRLMTEQLALPAATPRRNARLVDSALASRGPHA